MATNNLSERLEKHPLRIKAETGIFRLHSLTVLAHVQSQTLVWYWYIIQVTWVLGHIRYQMMETELVSETLADFNNFTQL
jgi:hypothetical protein